MQIKTSHHLTKLAAAVVALSCLQAFFQNMAIAQSLHCLIEPEQVDQKTSLPLPTFQFERALWTHCAVDDEEMHSCSSLPRPLELRRAKNLLATRHYDEAINDYKNRVEQYREIPWDTTLYREYGLAFEKLGKYNQALQIYRKGNEQQQKAKLLVRLGQYVEAQATASKNLAEFKAIAEKNQGSNYGEIPEWYRLRAAASAGLGNYDGAVSDLKEAAKLYLQSDSEKASNCVKDANQLIATHKTGKPLIVTAADLPQVGKDQVAALLHFMATDKNPFSLAQLNELANAHIKMPGSTFIDDFQEERLGPWLKRLEYRSSNEDYLLPGWIDLTIATDKCCLAKTLVMGWLHPGLPHNKRSVDFSGYDSHAESLLLPGGNTLNLSFSQGGLEILEQISLVAADDQHRRLASEDPAYALWCQGLRAASFDRPCGITTPGLERAVDLYTKSIAIDSERPDSFRDRARALCKLSRNAKALSDANSAIKIGGRAYIPERAAIEAASGNYKAAIDDLQDCLKNHVPGPETRALRLSLAEALIKDKQYEKAVQTANEAMVNTKDITRAIFLRGQAEAGSGDLVAAKQDGKVATQQYFDQARIVFRDEVIQWLATLPASDHLSLGVEK